MSLAYLSTDEVNLDLAARLAASCGTTLHLLSPQDPPPDGRFEAVLYDLDALPPRRRQEIVAGLLDTSSSCPVAVHAYNLEEETDALRDKGVVVARRLEEGVIRALCRSLG